MPALLIPAPPVAPSPGLTPVRQISDARLSAVVEAAYLLEAVRR